MPPTSAHVRYARGQRQVKPESIEDDRAEQLLSRWKPSRMCHCHRGQRRPVGGAQQTAELGWFPWLASAFSDLLPIVNVALGVNIAVYLLYMFYDEEPLKSVTQIILSVLAYRSPCPGFADLPLRLLCL